MRLDAKTVAALRLDDKQDAIFFDAELRGFGYRLRRSGETVRASWIAQYRRAGGQRRMLLGSASVLTADQARAAAKKVLAKVALGEDPQADKMQERAADRLTVRALVEEYLADRKGELRAKTLRDTTTYLVGSYFKPLHGTAIEKVSRRDVAACLTRIKRERSPIVAGIARAKLTAFFTWAMRKGFVEVNPVIGTEQPKRVAPRGRVLSDNELAAIWRACGDDDYGRIVKLMILTACRRKEIGGMAWPEFDFVEHRTWTLPAERAKNKRALTLPLMPMMREIVDTVPRMVGRDHLFGVRASGGFANWGEGKHALDKRSGVAGWQLRDTRRSVATKMADIGIQPHIIEAVLNHYSGHRAGVAGVYNKSPYEREVRAALALWEDHVRALVEGGARKVVPLRAE